MPEPAIEPRAPLVVEATARADTGHACRGGGTPVATADRHALPSAGGSAPPGGQAFATPGSHAVPSGVTHIAVDAWGGGGGGSGGSGLVGGDAGGGGALVRGLLPVGLAVRGGRREARGGRAAPGGRVGDPEPMARWGRARHREPPRPWRGRPRPSRGRSAG